MIMMLVFTAQADADTAQAAITAAMNFPVPVNAATGEQEPHVSRTSSWARPVNRYDDSSLWFFPKPPDPYTAAIPSAISYAEEPYDPSWEPPPPPDPDP